MTISDTTLNEQLNKFCGTEDVDFLDSDIGISNLFKYVVPMLDYYDIKSHKSEVLSNPKGEFVQHYASVALNDKHGIGVADTPEEALAMAVSKVVGESKTTTGMHISLQTPANS